MFYAMHDFHVLILEERTVHSVKPSFILLSKVEISIFIVLQQ